jgi:hypothetical protein
MNPMIESIVEEAFFGGASTLQRICRGEGGLRFA